MYISKTKDNLIFSTNNFYTFIVLDETSEFITGFTWDDLLKLYFFIFTLRKNTFILRKSEAISWSKYCIWSLNTYQNSGKSRTDISLSAWKNSFFNRTFYYFTVEFKTHFFFDIWYKGKVFCRDSFNLCFSTCSLEFKCISVTCKLYLQRIIIDEIDVSSKELAWNRKIPFRDDFYIIIYSVLYRHFKIICRENDIFKIHFYKNIFKYRGGTYWGCRVWDHRKSFLKCFCWDFKFHK